MSALNENAIVRLATVSSVDMNTAADVALYNVPVGKECLVAFIIVRRASINMTTASYSFGFTAPDYKDVKDDDYYAELIDDTVFVRIDPKLGTRIGSGGEVLYMKINTPQGAAATTTVEVFGYLF